MPKRITMTSAMPEEGLGADVFTDEERLAALAQDLVAVEWYAKDEHPAKVKVVGLQALRAPARSLEKSAFKSVNNLKSEVSQSTNVTELKPQEKRRGHAGKG